MNKKEFLRKRKEVRKKYTALKIIVPLCCLLIMGIIGLLIPLRPKVSSVEKRNLTSFPEFSVGDFLDGTYTTNIGLWYADTFPMRDQMIAGNELVTSCYGLKQQKIYGDMKKGDAIPDLDSVESVNTDTTQNNGAANTSDQTEPQTDATAQTEPQTEPPTEKETEPLKDGTIHEKGETFGTVYVADNRAFSVYYFNQTAADTYARQSVPVRQF